LSLGVLKSQTSIAPVSQHVAVNAELDVESLQRTGDVF
jgi:hypothetical protein